MSGIRTQCRDNPATGRIGCGAQYGGAEAHCVARVFWSEHPDGRAHLTFARDSLVELCWTGETMRHPSAVVDRDGRPQLRFDDGIWRSARRMDPEAVKRARAGVTHSPQSDETGRGGT